MTPMSPEEERRLVKGLRRRDERAFTRLVQRFQTPVYNLVVRMLGGNQEEALDVAQEVFVTVFRAIDGFRGDSKLSTWIYRIAVNHCRNRLKYLARRHSKRHARFEDVQQTRAARGDAFQSEIPRPDAQVEGLIAEVVLKEAIASLDPEQREVLVLRDVEGMTYEEIVGATGLPLGTVKSRIHRARQAVQRAWRAWKDDGVS